MLLVTGENVKNKNKNHFRFACKHGRRNKIYICISSLDHITFWIIIYIVLFISACHFLNSIDLLSNEICNSHSEQKQAKVVQILVLSPSEKKLFIIIIQFLPLVGLAQ